MNDTAPTPLDTLMQKHGLKNHDLVAVSTDGLTHKQVQKGRKGRPLTRRIQLKIAAALSAKGIACSADQLFRS